MDITYTIRLTTAQRGALVVAASEQGSKPRTVARRFIDEGLRRESYLLSKVAPHEVKPEEEAQAA